MKEVLFDAILGGGLLGLISYLSNVYGKSSPMFFKILAFMWSVPLTYFFFINMASRYGKTPVENFARHAIIGTSATLILSIIIFAIINFVKDVSTEQLVKLSFIYALIITFSYFILKIYEV